MGNGRAVPELDELTFDNGMIVRVRRVSPMLSTEIMKSWRKRNPAPQPPVQTVDIMGAKKQEINWSDPSYAQAMMEWQQRQSEEVGFLTLRMMVTRGVEVEVDKVAVQALRDDMEQLGVELDSDDKYVYVTAICCTSAADMNRLRDAIMVTSQPTTQEIQSAVDTFRSEVPPA